MKLRKIAEIGAGLCAAAVVGLNSLQPKKKPEPKKSFFREHQIALSLIAAGLALWEIKKHRHASA